MAESGGEDEGQNLLAVVVDINPNQVTSAWTNGNCMQKHLAKEETVNYITLAVVVRAETQLYESTTQLRTLPDQLTSYARTKVFRFIISSSLSTLQEIDKYSIISQTTQTQSSSGGSTCVRLLFPLPLRRSQRRRQAFETAGRTGCLLMVMCDELTALMTSFPDDNGCPSDF